MQINTDDNNTDSDEFITINATTKNNSMKILINWSLQDNLSLKTFFVVLLTVKIFFFHFSPSYPFVTPDLRYILDVE